jgi:glycosyltransferase involved in cell wall biosynthesis
MIISIIIPNYNKSKYLTETINSVKYQSLFDWECIIVDDFSCDNSVEIIENEIKDDNRFTLIKNRTNMGASFSRNLGLKKSSGRYILFLDSDDVLSKYCLEKRINFFNKFSNLDYAVFKMGTFYKSIGDSSLEWSDFRGDHLKRFLSHNLPWHTMMVLWKKNTLIELNGFEESFNRCQDVELHTRALIFQYKYKISLNNKIDSYFRIDSKRINNYYDFLKNDISGKINYYNYFKKLLIDSKNVKYLKGSIFESYILIFNFYKIYNLSSFQCKTLVEYLENSYDLNNWSTFDRIWILIYKFFKKRKFSFKGLNFFFKLILIK